MKKTVVYLLLFTLFGLTLIQSDTLKNDRFKDVYNKRTSKYTNKKIGFSITFNKGWNIYFKNNKLPGVVRASAEQLYTDISEMLMFGLTGDNMGGTMAIVEVIELDLDKYVELSMLSKKNTIDEVVYTDFKRINGYEVVESSYTATVQKMEYQYIEYSFDVNGQKVRVLFWTLRELFEDNKPAYEKIFKTLEIFK